MDGCERKEDNILKELLAKINHPLLEVRSRSLRSVVFKLGNDLLTVSDLVHEREFLCHLLEWFNFDEWALESKVLSLLAQLTQHDVAAKTLVEIGGIDFLSQLRLHCDTSLHHIIDEILDGLFKVPSGAMSVSLTSEDAAAQSCSNHATFTTESTTTDFGSYPQISRESFGLHFPPTSVAVQCQQQCTPSSKSSLLDIYTPSHTTGIPSSWTNSDLDVGNSQDVFRTADLGLHYTAVIRNHPISAVSEDTMPHAAINNDNDTQHSVGLFPWIPLTQKDCHVLLTTQNHFKSCKVDSMEGCYEFIQDVLFQDFPAEVFLQRPCLIQSLFHFLDHSDSSACRYSTMHCLLTFNRYLRERVANSKCFSMVPSDKLTNSTARVHSEVKDRDPLHQTTTEMEVSTPEILEQQLSEQISVQQYCTSVIVTASALLLGYLHKDIPVIAGDSLCSTSVTRHVVVCLRLITSAVELLQEIHVSWTSEGQLLERSVVSVCSAISQCLSKWRRLATQSTAPQLQLVCSVTVCLAYCLSSVLSLSGQIDFTQMNESSCVGGVLNGLMMNGVLGVVCPDLLEGMLSVFEMMDETNSRLFGKVKTLALSFAKVSDFLSCYSTSKSSDSLIKLASEGLQGLWFHCSEPFVTNSIQVCLSVLMAVRRDKEDWNTAKSVLLQLLGHGSSQVRRIAFVQFEKLVNEGLSVLHGTVTEVKETSKLPEGILSIVVDHDVLQILCTNAAAFDSNIESTVSSQLLVKVISLKNELCWPEIMDCIVQWMPFIEVAMSHREQLCREMQHWLDSQEQFSSLPELIRLQCYIRLLFSDCRRVRVWSFTRLSKLIISQCEEGKPFPFPTQSPIPLHDVLITQSTKTQFKHTVGRDGSFQYEDVTKLMGILNSPTLELSLKKSAMEQLSRVLQDQLLHAQALDGGVCEYLVTLLKSCHSQLTSHYDHCKETLLLCKPTIECLQHLTYCSPDWRQKLYNDSTLLMTLIKVAVLLHKDVEAVLSISKLLCLLLFSCAGGVINENVLQLPHCLMKSIKVPFSVNGYDSQSKCNTECCLDLGLLKSDPILSMLRLHYHVTMVGSVSELVSNLEQLQVEDEELSIPLGDVRALQCVCLATSLPDLISQLKEATSYDDVGRVLCDTEVVLLSQGSQDTARMAVNTVDWKGAIERFLIVLPSTPKDMELFDTVLQFILGLMNVLNGDSHQEHFMWLMRTTCGHNAICLDMLESLLTDKISVSHRMLQKTILRLYAELLRAAGSNLNISDIEVCDSIKLLDTLYHYLELAGSPSHYDLCLLEHSMECLFHLTASLKICSMPVLMKLLSSLYRIMWSFVAGEGLMIHSFMGKGVALRAALTMSHLVLIANALNPPEEWWLQWLQSSPSNNLTWLYRLFQDRDPKVRYAGLSLLGLLCSKPSVAEVMLIYCSTDDRFGLWGASMRVAVDKMECSLVRQQALFLLVNLSNVCIRQKKWSTYLMYNSDEGTIKGQKALEALLQSLEFFPMLQLVIDTQAILMLKEEISSSTSYRSSLQLGRGDSIITGILDCCDPYVLSGVCLLLCNLIQAFSCLIGDYIHDHNIVTHFMSVLDPVFLNQFLVATRGESDTLSVSWIRMTTALLELLKTMVVLRSKEILPQLLNQVVMSSLCGHLAARCPHEDTLAGAEFQKLCSAVLSLLQTIMVRVSYSEAELVFSVLQTHWVSFTDLLVSSVLKSDIALKTNVLTVLFLILVHHLQSFKKNKSSHDLLDACHQEGEGCESTSSGSRVCLALMKAYDHSNSFTEERRLIGECLGLLLAISSSAKDTALKDGLMESSIELLKSLHTKLCIESLDHSPHVSRKKQESLIVSELVATVTVLRNFMFKSLEVKSASIRCHLTVLVNSMWPSCTVNKRLMCAVLQMLTVFCAQCSEGRASLASASKGATSLFQKVLKLASQTITRYNSCTASKISNPHRSILIVVFTLISNCVLSQECRAIMKKTSFLSHFTTLIPKSETGMSRSPATKLSTLWIKVLVNLSFSTEGQNMILKESDSLDVMIDILQNCDSGTQTKCLLLLRNLCFYGPSKPLIASNENILQALANALESGIKTRIAIAMSAMWALMYNCTSIRKSLRKSELSSKLNAAASFLAAGNTDQDEDKRYRHILVETQSLL